MSDTAPRVRHVDARFGGRTVRFEIAMTTANLDSLERALGPAYAAFKRFDGGRWSVADVRTILTFGFPIAGEFGECGALPNGYVVPEVAAAQETRPLAVYAPLAAKVMEALIFGLDAADAVFDEDAIGV